MGGVNREYTLLNEDVYKTSITEKHDLIIIHDVIEHVLNKERLLQTASTLLKDDGILFIGFPPWQMPFGGHQQICHNKWMSSMPFIHLLPKNIYKSILTQFKESNRTIEELLDIKQCATSIELFKRTLKQTDLHIISEKYYFINPHYKIKFGLRPLTLISPVRDIPYVRNFFATSYLSLLGKGERISI